MEPRPTGGLGALVIAPERQAHLAGGRFDPDAMPTVARGAATSP